MESKKLLITKREKEIETLKALSGYIANLHNEVGLTPETFAEINAKISSRMAQCEISIRDHS